MLQTLTQLLRPLRLLGGLITLTAKRMISRPGLTILALIGIVLAVGLLNSAGFFAQAVDKVILLEELGELSQATGRPPFSTRVYFFPSSRKPMPMDVAEDAGRSISRTLAQEIGLPIKRVGIQIESGSMSLMPRAGDTRYGADNTLLTSVNVIYIVDVADELDIVDGDPFDADHQSAPDMLNVWMHANLAGEMGIRSGETFNMAANIRQEPQPIHITGIWQALDGNDEFWFSPPDIKLKDALLVSRHDYVTFIQPRLAGGSRFASWHITLDDGRLNPSLSRQYAAGFERGMAIVDKFVPGASLDVSPLDPLKEFVERQTTLTTMLLGFNMPALGFLVYFLVLISAIIARWQVRETAVLVSRGMGRGGVVTLVAVEELLLFIVGIPLGLGFGMLLARWMGYTVSFLSFTSREPLPVSFQGINVWLIVIALSIALMARLLPAVQASGKSVLEQERSSSRTIQPPFWQRAFLDFLLIIPTWYAYEQLANRGSLAALIEDQAEDLFQDPLLVLVPALFVLTASLLVMRLFPLLMRLLDTIASATIWLPPHLALRQLGRHSQSYINPLLLVIVSLALGIYTHSMAASLDQWLVDRIYYAVGADTSFEPYVEATEDELGGEWIPPKAEFADLPNVTAVSRVANYPVRFDLAGVTEDRGNFMAVERADFTQVAWFRNDFTSESLGAVMNRLATTPESVLISETFRRDNYLQIGDQLPLRVTLDDGIVVQETFLIVGIYDHFPTVYADDVTVIGNMDHLFLLGGATFPHNIWLRLEGKSDGKELQKAILKKGVEPIRWRHTPTLIAEEQAQMERVGIFGTLSVGFLAAAVMAFLALLIHSYASLQERLYQFGVLRAVGVMRRQLIGQIVLEYALLASYGSISGAVIGATASELFTPFFRITAQEKIPLPPLIPIIAEDQILRLALIFAGMIVLVELGVTVQALSRRLFDALRMGYLE